MSDNLWCFVWTRETADTDARPTANRYFCTSTLSPSRSTAWDSILETWYSKSGSDLYIRNGTAITRAGAIHYLKRRGGRVLKVKVVPT